MEPTMTETAETAAPPRPTPARTWAQRGDGLYELPGSGHVARLRRPSLLALAGAGAVPNPLSAEVLRYLARRDDRPGALSEERQIAEYRRNARAFMEVAQRCLIEPRLALPPLETPRGRDAEPWPGPDYDAGEIGPEDLADRDYTWLFFSFVTEGESVAAAFRVG